MSLASFTYHSAVQASRQQPVGLTNHSPESGDHIATLSVLLGRVGEATCMLPDVANLLLGYVYRA